MFRLSALLVLFLFTSLARAGDVQQLLQLIDYIGVDYAEAIADGEIINPNEYEEMQDFSAGIVQQLGDLPESEVRAELQRQAGRLTEQIAAKAAYAAVLCHDHMIMRIHPAPVTFSAVPQPEFSIRIPAAMPDPSAAVIGQPVD